MFGNKMKGLVTIALVLAVAVPVFADTSATLSISATMPVVQEISLSATSVSWGDISTATTGLALASITAKCNSKSGYDIKVASSNNGYLKTGDGSSQIPYTLKFGTGATPFSPTTTAASIASVSSKTSKTGTVTALTADLTSVSDTYFDAGVYNDTLTISIVAK
jgi:hypothetical protein